jgi:putative endonuclease
MEACFASISGYGSASQTQPAKLLTMNFTYVYILQSEANPDRFYVGLTDELQERLRKHNAGEVSHTAKFKPWVFKTAIVFRDRKRAACI